MNLHRRHLSTSQRGMIAARMANMKQHDNRFTIDTSKEVSISQAQASRLMNVTVATTQRAKRVIEHGIPEPVKAVERDEVTVCSVRAYKPGGRL